MARMRRGGDKDPRVSVKGGDELETRVDYLWLSGASKEVSWLKANDSLEGMLFSVCKN